MQHAATRPMDPFKLPFMAGVFGYYGLLLVLTSSNGKQEQKLKYLKFLTCVSVCEREESHTWGIL